MSSPAHSRPVRFKFGPYCLDLHRHLLLRSSKQVFITPKVFEVLRILVENRTEVVAKERLIAAMWPDCHVSETNLTQTIFMLRKALDDQATAHRYILTVPGKGYSFAGEVECDTGADTSGASWRYPAFKRVIEAAFLMLAITLLISPPRRTPRFPFRHSRLPVIAVRGINNVSPDDESAWIGIAITQILSSELSSQTGKTGLLRWDLPDSNEPIVNPDIVVSGTYSFFGQNGIRLRIDVRERETGAQLGVATAVGSTEELIKLGNSAVTQVRAILGLQANPPGEQAALLSLSSETFVLHWYFEALHEWRHFDPVSAQILLEKAVAHDPNQPLLHTALSLVFDDLGYEEKARREAEIGFHLSRGYPADLQLWTEARYRETTRDWSSAAAIYGKLYDLSHDPDYGLHLAEVERRGGLIQQAYSVIAQLHRTNSEDPRIDIAEARVADFASDSTRAKTAAEIALRKASKLQMPVAIANAELLLGAATDSNGDLKDALSHYGRALAVYRSIDDQSGACKALLGIANIYESREMFAEAQGNFQRVLRIAQRIGNKGLLARALLDYGNLAYARGQLKEADRLYSAAQNVYGEVNDQNGAAGALLNKANALVDQGRYDDAESELTQVLGLARKLGNNFDIIAALSTLGDLNFYRGELAASEHLYSESLALSERFGSGIGKGYALTGLAEILRVNGDLENAVHVFQHALTLGRENVPGFCPTDLAETYIELDQPRAAQKLLRKSLEKLPQADVPNRSRHYAMLARAFLAGGDLQRAQRAIKVARVLAQNSEFADIRLDLAINDARIFAASQRMEQAIATATAASSEAHRIQDIPRQLEADLLLDVIQKLAGNAVGSSERVSSLQRYASNKSFNLFWRKLLIAEKSSDSVRLGIL